MLYQTDIHPTAKDLSPEELAVYRQRLNEHFRKRQVDKALLHRAWQTAHRVAAMLYEKFGATRVAVFGSLAERDWFSPCSDIDIAVWGIPADKYLKAVVEAKHISRWFKVDLVDFDSCEGLFRENVQSQAVPIEKGTEFGVPIYRTDVQREAEDVYEGNSRKLIWRIATERAEIERVVAQIGEALQHIEEAPARYRHGAEIEIARYLYEIYMGMENIFREIARDFDGDMPDGAEWHKALLKQMAAAREERPPLISQKTLGLLENLLGFRHVFTHIYSVKLNYEETEKNAKRVGELADALFAELDTFIAFLNGRENDE